MKRISGLVVTFLIAVVLIFGTQINSARTATNPGNTVPIGTIVPYAGLVKGNATGQLSKQGWLVCNGDPVSRTDYAELSNVIGNFYGSVDDPTMFKLPDLRGRFLRGVDDGAGRDPDAKNRTASAEGGNKGDKVGSAQEDALMSHTHQVVSWGDTGAESNKTAANNTAFSNRAFTRGDGSVSTSTKTPAVLANGKLETRPKNIYVNYIIKAKNV